MAFRQNTKDRRLEIANHRLELAQQQAEKAQLNLLDGSTSNAAQLAAIVAKVAAVQAQVDYLRSVVTVEDVELSPEKVAAKVAAAQRVIDHYGPSAATTAIVRNGRDQLGHYVPEATPAE